MAAASSLFRSLLLLSLSLSAAAAGIAEAKARAKNQLKTAVRRDVLGARVGYERLRGNTMELTGVMAGGALVFAGARAPSPARRVQSSLVAQTATRSLGLGCHTGVAAAALAGAAIAQVPVAAALVPWAVIGCVAGRASQGIVNASSAAPGVQASLRRDLPPLAALAGWAVALRASRALGLSVEIVASSLLGGVAVVEITRQHLREEFDQIALALRSSAVALKPAVRLVLRLRRALLPLPRLVKNDLNVVKTAAQSAATAVETAYGDCPPPRRAAIVVAAVSATRVPGVRGAARKAVGAAAWGQVYGRAQAALPSFLREQNVTARVRRFAERFPPLALARRAWAGGKSLLLRGSRFALPFFLAGWGCAVQAGRLRRATRRACSSTCCRSSGPRWCRSRRRGSSGGRGARTSGCSSSRSRGGSGARRGRARPVPGGASATGRATRSVAEAMHLPPALPRHRSRV